MPIARLSDIVKGSILVTASGAHYVLIEPPVVDNAQVSRFFVSPVNRVGRVPIYHAGCIARGNRFFAAAGAVGDLCFVTSFPVDNVVSAHLPGELDLSAIPYTMDPGLFELKDGGRLLIQGTRILLGRRGVVTAMTIGVNGVFKFPDGSEFTPGPLTATSHGVLTKASDFEVGDVFSVESRIFRRREHGIEPADGGPRVPMSELAGTMYAMTTTVTRPHFEVGSIIKVKANAYAKVIDLDGSKIVWVITSGRLHSANLNDNNKVPASSEFQSSALQYDGFQVVPAEPGTVSATFPEPRPLSDIPDANDVVEFDGNRRAVYNAERPSGSKWIKLRTRGLRSDMNAYDEERRWLWNDGENSIDLFKVGDKVYGLPPALVRHGTWRYLGTPVLGALYLIGDGRIAAALVPDLDMLVIVGGNTAPDSPEHIEFEPTAVCRYNIIAKLADPGCWSAKIRENGLVNGAHDAIPETTILAAGFAWPVSAKGRQRIETLLCETCPQCQARHSVNNSHRALVLVDGTYHESQVCRACCDRFEACQSCGVRVSEFDNGFSVCNACQAHGQFEVIHSYNYKPKTKMHGEGPLYFGTEVELVFRGSSGGRNSTAKEVLNRAKGLFYAKNDGSIGEGIEFVTHPFSMAWLNGNEELMRSVFARMHESMKESSACGIHIHTSKPGFEVLSSSVPNGETLTRERLIGRGLMRVQRFIYGNRDLTIHFAGRESSFASLGVTGLRGGGERSTTVREMKQLSENLTLRKSCRYAAVNMTKDTVEFRIFKSTTDYDEYRRNVLFIDSVIQYCRKHALPKNGAVGIAAYKRFIGTSSLYLPVAEHLELLGAPRCAAADAGF